MCQTFTSQIELNALHPSEDTRAVLTETVQYFSYRSSPNPSTVDPSTNPDKNPAMVSGFRIGSILIEEKAIILLKSYEGVFAVGINDTATGANLYSMQEHYDLPYAVVSLVFLAGFGG
ncbi:hypothetical protein B0J17DRAFT_625895 [Rhizoctonia solani]|nr:hypothetical protein B0J17DRAFT_625895 [Rhizoctonia solani]